MATKKPTKPLKARRLEDISKGREGVFLLDYPLIRPEPDFNPRRHFQDIEALAEDIWENRHLGVPLQPLRIRKLRGTETIWLVDGERRWRAIGHLIATGRDPGPVRCISEPLGTSELDRLFVPLSANTGRDLSKQIVANLVGSPDLIKEKIAGLKAIGVDHACALMIPADSMAEFEDQVEWFAKTAIA